MSSKVLLNNIDHYDLRVVPGWRPGFGDQANLIRLLPSEFEAAQREFPILFRRDGEGQVHAVALLGLDRDENLFLGAQGWTTRHVPVLQQRGPFSIVVPTGEGGAGGPMVHVDLDDPRLSRNEGLPLFLPMGGNAPYLDHVSAILRTIWTGTQMEKGFSEALEQHGLIEQINLSIAVDEARTWELPDFLAVADHRLAALDGTALELLSRAGHLRPAIMAAASLANLQHLTNLKRAG